MFTRLTTSALIAACLSLTACDGELRSVDAHLARAPQPNTATLIAPLATEIPRAEDRLALSARTWRQPGTAVYAGRNRTFKGATNRFYESTFREGMLADIVTEFDLRTEVPLYRFRFNLVNRETKLSTENAKRIMNVVATTPGRDFGERMVLRAPVGGSDPVTFDAQGRALTAWVFCPDCIANADTSTLDGQRILTQRIADIRRMRSGNWLGFGVLQFKEEPINGSFGLAARRDAEAFGTDVAEFRERSETATAANRAYAAFFRQIYEPLTLRAFANQQGCPSTYSPRRASFNLLGNHEDIVSGNREYIACYGRAIEGYDFAGYAQLYPELVARERALWEASFGIERRPLSDGPAQLRKAERSIAGAERGIEDASAAIAEIRQDTAARRARDAQMRDFFTATQSIIDRQRAQNAAGQRRLDSAAAAAVRNSTPGRATASSAGSAQIATARSRLASDIARVPAETGTRRAAETAPVVATAEPQAQVSRPTPVSGSAFGCVSVVGTDKRPGSSALSSCNYDTPDRESLKITFLNSCSVPVNIRLSLAMDTGETRTSSLSNSAP
ncbi:MAG: hypothetical protein AAFQ51_09775, partial [Pseudomonadota bacterium]